MSLESFDSQNTGQKLSQTVVKCLKVSKVSQDIAKCRKIKRTLFMTLHDWNPFSKSFLRTPNLKRLYKSSAGEGVMHLKVPFLRGTWSIGYADRRLLAITARKGDVLQQISAESWAR